ncbi:MAG: hypothetical protein Kow00109_21300 [Acidobacteriota bacterium]
MERKPDRLSVLYRGQSIGGAKRLHDLCRDIIQDGNPEEILEILPHLRVLRDASFKEPLLRLLETGNIEQKAAAVEALATLADADIVPRLLQLYREARDRTSAGWSRLLTAVLSALGEFPHEDAAQALISLLPEGPPSPRVRTLWARLITAALGQQAQQEVEAAERALADLVRTGPAPLQALAVTELAIAFWHRPQGIPMEYLELLAETARDPRAEVASSAREALTSLSRIGSAPAEAVLASLEAPRTS